MMCMHVKMGTRIILLKFILKVALIPGLSNGGSMKQFFVFKSSVRFVHDIGDGDTRQADALFPCGFE